MKKSREEAQEIMNRNVDLRTELRKALGEWTVAKEAKKRRARLLVALRA